MIKRMMLVPKREDLSNEEFRSYLDQTHIPLVKRLPGLRRLRVNYVQASGDGSVPTFACVGEEWYDDAEAMQAAFSGPEGQAVKEDGPKLAGHTQILVVEEVEVPLA